MTLSIPKLGRPVYVVTVLSLLAAACGGDDAAQTTSTSAPATTTTSTAVTTSTTAATVPAITTTTLPGQPVDFGPNSGDILGVVAIAFDDVLNLRAGPGTDFDVLKKLAARTDRVISNGRAQELPNFVWYEITAAGVTGWSSSTFLAFLGPTDDITSNIVDDVGEIPRADTMADLGQIVADTYPATQHPLRVRMSGAPSVGDLGEVIYDIVGFVDDSVRGLRLHVFGQPAEDGTGFSLKSVEATSLCARGVTGDGLCV